MNLLLLCNLTQPILVQAKYEYRIYAHGFLKKRSDTDTADVVGCSQTEPRMSQDVALVGISRYPQLSLLVSEQY